MYKTRSIRQELSAAYDIHYRLCKIWLLCIKTLPRALYYFLSSWITGFQYPATMVLVTIFTIGCKNFISHKRRAYILRFHVADSHILTRCIEYVIGKNDPLEASWYKNFISSYTLSYMTTIKRLWEAQETQIFSATRQKHFWTFGWKCRVNISVQLNCRGYFTQRTGWSSGNSLSLAVSLYIISVLGSNPRRKNCYR